MNEIYYIPANYTDAGRILGLFPLRNLIETVILVLPLNFHLKPDFEKSNIIANYATFLKIAPANLQVQVITQKVDMHDYIQRKLM